jgi:hypothetical protein
MHYSLLSETYLPFVLDISQYIYKISKQKRDNYCEYLRLSNFLNCKKKAIVDIGYQGRIQQALYNISRDENLGGYYYSVNDTAETINACGLFLKGFNEHFISNDSSFRKIKLLKIPPVLIEILTLNGKPSFIDMQLTNNGNLKFLFDARSYDQKTRNIMKMLHHGAIDFVSDFNTHFSSFFKHMVLNCDDIMELCLTFLQRPTPEDIQIFEGAIFENKFANAPVRYIIPPMSYKSKKEFTSKNVIWLKGAEILFDHMELRKNYVKSILLLIYKFVVNKFWARLTKQIIFNKK